MVYAADSPASALLKILVHLKIDPKDLPSTLLLPAPSAIIPYTTNYLFNPLHTEANGARLEVERFPLDLRLI